LQPANLLLLVREETGGQSYHSIHRRFPQYGESPRISLAALQGGDAL
jgi:hypothetical protein